MAQAIWVGNFVSPHKLVVATFLIVLVCLELSSCATNNIQDVMQAAKGAAQKTNPLNATFEGTPIEVYSQIARGSNACWFSPRSKLRKGYMYHAVTSPDRKNAQIGIHQLDKDGRRGLKSITISMWSTGKGTAIAATNHRFQQTIFEQMEADIKRWAAGEESCSDLLKPPFAAPQAPSVEKNSGQPVVTPVIAGPEPKP